MALSQLCITLKDHKLAEPLKKMILNKLRLAREKAIERGEEEHDIDIPVDESIKPVNIYVSPTISTSIHATLSKELPHLRLYNIDFNLDMSVLACKYQLLLYIICWSEMAKS